jgi:hypothetical protein
LLPFVDTAPFGYVLRALHKDHWVRFHSLPDGERLPDGPSAMKEILRRYNAVASALFGLEGYVVAWSAEYDGRFARIGKWRRVLKPLPWKVDNAEFREKLQAARLWCFTSGWRPTLLDSELRRVARGDSGPLSVTSEWAAFCPYDGGMDVFLRERKLVGAIRNLFSEWPSTSRHLANRSERSVVAARVRRCFASLRERGEAPVHDPSAEEGADHAPDVSGGWELACDQPAVVPPGGANRVLLHAGRSACGDERGTGTPQLLRTRIRDRLPGVTSTPCAGASPRGSPQRRW